MYDDAEHNGMEYDQRPRSLLAVLALIMGVAAFAFILLILLGALLLSERGGMMLVAIALPVTAMGAGVFALSAVLAGHMGIPDTRPDGKRGRGMATTGMVMGYLNIFLAMAVIVAIQQFMMFGNDPYRRDTRFQHQSMRQHAMLQVQEGGIASAMGACDLTLGQAIMDNTEFSCQQADDNLEVSQGLTITITQHGEHACLITATMDGSDTPTTKIWSYQPR